MTEYIDIDGSVLEGGGQILRISISLSAILGKPVRITNIRANRSKPGLAAQHLKGIQLVADMCQGKVKGANIGSTEIEFLPRKIRGGIYFADTKTAGSISLLLQVALPVALLADDTVLLDLKGGTNADMAPQVDYMLVVFRQILKQFGGDFQLDIIKRGYYPKGGGHVLVTTPPVPSLRCVNITHRGELAVVRGYSYVAGTLPVKMAYQMAEGAKKALSGMQSLPRVDIECYKEDRQMAPDNCAGIILYCETLTDRVLGSDALGKRSLDSATVGKTAGEALRRELESGAAIDSHLQDQLIVYMALAQGRSCIRVGEVTLHTKTAIHVVETITKLKFNIRPDRGQNIIECTGLGLINSHLID